MLSRPLSVLIGMLVAGPAFAAEPVTLSLDLGVVSDYRFRGVSYSGKDPAVQGEISAEHSSGAHAGLWASTISETAGGAHLELDLEAGWLFEASEALSLDLGATYYLYPGDSAANYAEPALTAFHKFGSATARLGLTYIPKQGATRDATGRKRDNHYAFLGLELPLKGTPVTLAGQIGYERGAFDLSPRGGKWDWQLGGAVEVKGISLGLSYVDAAVRGEGEENATDPTVVGSLLFGF
ncbi:MAG TPA: TorF family putative porin [Allosphingosinicella sp.]|jgi:uncharacterized protein (TIGR02001 family)|uniref:TorF family putative porin n=1 Tax=Allosphingosinicella sp. TaxID=2823234 RepID=UPI002F29F6A4